MSTIISVMAESCRRHDSRPALSEKTANRWRDISYRELWQEVEFIASGLLEQQLLGEPVSLTSISRSTPDAGKVRVRGRFDTAHHILLGPRGHGGSPGVHVVTPFLLENDGGVVLVNRGWLQSADASTAYPEDHDEYGVRDIIGITKSIASGLGGPPWRPREGDSSRVWSALTLDLDSLVARVPLAVAPWYIQELPGEGVPDKPMRLAPEPANEMTHLSYAMQWFLFATILLFGPLLVLRARRRNAGAPVAPAPDREVSVP